MQKTYHIHFVGIGGVGMGGIAKILANEGYRISGSDLNQNIITQQLKKIGVKIYFSHRPENIRHADMIVISSAISKYNPEIIAANKFFIPVIRRAEILAKIMLSRYSIVVAGTHGKTTTTAMLSSIYIAAGLDPTFINGGMIKSEGVYARLGRSNYLIAEADESDASFLYLQPMVAIITNIDNDHMDSYQGNFQFLKKAFIDFLHKVLSCGYAVMCIDDPVICELLPKINRKIITYGFKKNADVRIEKYQQIGTKVSFILIRQNKKPMKVLLNVPGFHNALNAASAVAVATQEGINDQIILHALKNFQGVTHRFDILGKFPLELINGKSGTVILVNDYGHHPTEVNVTIETARAIWPKKKLVMLFQPHRFTRTHYLYSDFVRVLSKVDILLIMNIYSAGEIPISGINSHSLCLAIRNQGIVNPILVSNFSHIIKILASVLTEDSLVIAQGAGDIGNIFHILANTLDFQLEPV